MLSPSPSLHPEKYGHPGHGLPISGSGLVKGKGRRTGLKSRTFQIMALRFGWVVVVIWFEVGEFFHSLSECKFPDNPLRPYTAPGAVPSHIVLVADPHVPHPILSHPEDSYSWMNVLRQAFDELFMRKSWNVVMRLGRIDGVIMLGDMLDTGRGLMTDEDYEDYYKLYSSIFTLPPETPVYHVPGNHDIPLGPWKQFSPYARERYAKHYGTPNEVISIANHSIVLLDSVSLVEEDYRRYASEMQFGDWDGVEGGVIEFVKSVGDEPMTGPRILISHIPLARPEGAQCGKYREHGRIQKGAGPGYQNLLGSETSQFLLEELQPSIVFSGDDHDYCEYTHSNRIREVTLKSFSTSTGIRRPGFQLLSLIPPLHPDAQYSNQPTLADRPCFLPDQAGVYTRVYLPLFVLTALYLFGTNLRNAYRRWAGSGYNEKMEKYRLSPNLSEASGFASRKVSDKDREKERDRPVPLTLPSRKSSQHLTTMGISSGQSTGTNASRGLWRVTSRTNMASPDFAASGSNGPFYGHRSVPPSPFGSPRPSFSMERNVSGYDNDDVSTLPSPALSRRSSFIYMNGSDAEKGANTSAFPSDRLLSAEPSNYFGAALSTSGGVSPTHTQPNSPLYRRTSHSNLQTPAPPQRRVTMPRLPSFVNGFATYSPSDAGAQTPSFAPRRGTTPGLPGPGSTGLPIPVLQLEQSHLAGDGLIVKIRRAYENVRTIVRWIWRTRESVLGRSAREVWAIFWVSGVVWIGVNALFFWG